MNARQRRRSQRFIYMNREQGCPSDAVQRRTAMVASRSVLSRSNRSTGSPLADRSPDNRFAAGGPFPRKAISMFRKVAIALIAASMLTAPVMAQVPASTIKPAATTSSAVKSVKSVKADKTTLKHRRHAHRGTRMAQHKHMNGTKHARHFNGGKGHKVAGATGKVVSAKPATRSN
jgi:hypothetical protein